MIGALFLWSSVAGCFHYQTATGEQLEIILTEFFPKGQRRQTGSVKGAKK
jgi:hypothetical protein